MDQLFERSPYDYIWSINSFFLNPEIVKLNVALCSFGPDTMDFNHPKQIEYLEQYKPLVGIELHYKLYQASGKEKLIKRINEQVYQLDKMFFFQSKFYSILGGGVRLIVLACNLGVSEIFFVGFDGYKGYNSSEPHSFEKGKRSLPSRVALYQNDINGRYQYEYDLFWHYIREKWPGTQVVSLDKENLYHRLVI